MGKESLEKKTSIKNKLKVNSNLFLDYKFVLVVLFISIISISGVVLSNPTFAESLDYNVVIKPSLKITLSSNNPQLTLNPTNHAFDNTTITSTVATNNPNGYKLYLSTTEGSGGTSGTELVNNTNSTYTIPTLESASPASTFPANYWGYRLSTGDNDNYLSYIPDALISENTEATNGTVSTVDFAAKVDYNKPSGLYNIAFDLKTIPIVSQTYMQNMDPTVCKTDSPTIVIDNRDEHPYLIQRLADGKCWMLDNLDLDLTNRTIVDNLTTTNTNINTTADPYALESLKNGARDQGAKYATAGLEYHNWTSSTGTPASPNTSFSQPLVNRSGKCVGTDTSDPCVGKWQNANYTNNTVIDTVDASNTKYNYGSGGYRIGTYYNYCAASAGSYCYGTESSTGAPSGDATSDICPAGWHMPSSNGGDNGDYVTLCSAIKGSACANHAWNDMAITDETSMQYQLSLPVAGRYSYSGNNIGFSDFRGTYGFFWSSTWSGGTSMRNLIIRSSGIYPQDNNSNSRLGGYSIRCVSS